MKYWKKLKKRRIFTIFGILLTPFIIFFIANLIFPLPSPYDNKNFSKVVLDSEGRPIRYFADSEGVWRYQVNLKEVSPKYIEALLGYEDQWFYKHPGINPVALVRALGQYVSKRKIVSGGSTITMQVARIIDPHSRSVSGKIKQIFRALQLELYYSKDEILEVYLNLAPFGGNIQGVQAASYFYFDRDIADVNYSEAALLAILPQTPSKMRPDRYPDVANEGKNKLAKRMLQLGYWDEDIVWDVLNDYISITGQKPQIAPILAEMLIDKYPDKKVIHTFINRQLQIFIEDQLLLSKNNLAPGTSAAVIVVDNNTNKVIAYSGSLQYGDAESYGYIDMTSSIRSPGSTLKPFIYGLALDKALIHSSSLLIDAPRVYSSYRAGNFYQNFSGPVTAESALQRSLNVPVVQLLDHVTPEYFVTAIKNTQVSFNMLGGKANLSIALGGGGMKLKDITMLFTSLANGGIVYPLVYTPYDDTDTPRFLMSEEAAYIVYEMLRKQTRYDNIYSNVTGKNNRLAWKTGTSYGFRDAFAIGVTKDYTIGVWVGKPDNVPAPGQYGAVTASPILFSISDYLEIWDGKKHEMQKPEDVIEVDICWPSGLAAENVKESDCHRKLKAMTIAGVTPATLPETPLDVSQTYLIRWLENEKRQRANVSCIIGDKIPKEAHIWPRLLEAWINSKYHASNIVPKWQEGCNDDKTLYIGSMIITSIVDNSTLKSASIAYNAKPILELQTAGGKGLIKWYLNGEYIANTYNNSKTTYQILSQGEYQLLAVDSENQLAIVNFYID